MSQMESVSFNTYRKQGHPQNSEQGQPWEETNRSDTLNVFDNSESRTPTLIIENHPNDSRVKIRENTVQTLSGRMGTGGVTYRCVWRTA
jgi:hypothetical protein